MDFANARLGEVTRLFAGIDLNLGPHLSVSLDHTYQKLKRSEGDIFTANQLDLRTSWQFNLRQTLTRWTRERASLARS